MPIQFDGPLKVEETGDGTVWRLLGPLSANDGEQGWQIPTGFHTDFSSIPRLARSIIPVLGRQNKASVLHDWLYVTKIVNRAEADRIFLAAMRSSGVSFPKRNAMYLAVRLGGSYVWQRD